MSPVMLIWTRNSTYEYDFVGSRVRKVAGPIRGGVIGSGWVPVVADPVVVIGQKAVFLLEQNSRGEATWITTSPVASYRVVGVKGAA